MLPRYLRAGITVVLLCLAAAGIAQQAQPLTNADIIKMTNARLGEKVILASIENAFETKFDTTADALIALKQAGVSDAVLAALLAGPTPKVSSAGDSANRSASSAISPVGRPAPGIYVDVGTGGRSELVQLEPTVISKIRTSGGLATALSFGISKISMIAEVRGNRANQRITQQQPDFYFYFDDKGSGGGPFVGWLAAASSPNEFVLLQMYRERDRREMDVAKGNAYGSSSAGVESENTVPVKIEKLAVGAYRVTPTEPLGKGEFSFFYAAGAGALQGGVAKLFDFGVD